MGMGPVLRAPLFFADPFSVPYCLSLLCLSNKWRGFIRYKQYLNAPKKERISKSWINNKIHTKKFIIFLQRRCNNFRKHF
jgi:hypothetical protein